MPYTYKDPILNPSSSIWISANAGSGKTQYLIDRLIALLLQGIPHTQILCLTYTKAAAMEMLNRIYDRLVWMTTVPNHELEQYLYDLFQDSPNIKMKEQARTLLISVLEHHTPLRIQTIHAFCEHLLTLFPMEAGVMPGFQLLDEQQSLALVQNIMPTFFTLCEKDPVLSKYLHYIIKYSNNYDKFYEIWLKLLHAQPTEPINLVDIPDDVESVLQATSFQAFLSSKHIQKIKSLCPYLDESKHPLLFKLADNNETPKSEISESLSKEYILQYLLKKDYTPRKPKTNPIQLKNFIIQEQQELTEFMHRKDLNKLQVWSFMIHHLKSLWQHLYTEEKHATNTLDFNDLLIKSKTLLNQLEHQWIAYKLDSSIYHILIDEAQDMSKIQWDLVCSLSNHFFDNQDSIPKSVFVVGDIKQSIYSFQGAEPTILDAIKKYFKDLIHPLEQATKKQIFFDIPLSHSYRMPNQLTEFVDTSISNLPSFSSEISLTSSHSSKKTGGKIIMLPPFEGKIEIAIPKLAHHLIRLLKKTLWKLWIPSKGRPLEPKDIFILLQRRSSDVDGILFNAMVHAGLPIQISKTIDYKNNLAILDIISLIRFILTPYDNLNFANVLKSNFIQLNDYDLLLLKTYEKNSESLYQTFQQSCSSFPSYTAITQWLHTIKHLPITRSYDFISSLLQHSSLFGSSLYNHLIKIFPQDTQQFINQFLHDCKIFEAQNSESLLKFIESFLKNSSKMDIPSHENAITITSVHGVKGKEAPFIILADSLRHPKTLDSNYIVSFPLSNYFTSGSMVSYYQSPFVKDTYFSHPQQKAYEEYYRLMYVAFTRSSDILMITGFQTKKSNAKTSTFKSLKELSSWYDIALTSTHVPTHRYPIGIGKLYKDNKNIFNKNIPSNTSKLQNNKHDVITDSEIAFFTSHNFPFSKPYNEKQKESFSNNFTNTTLEFPKTTQITNTSLIKSADYGIIIHQLLQVFHAWNKNYRKEYTLEFLKRHHIPKAITLNIYQHIRYLWDQSPLSVFLQNPSMLSEKSFVLQKDKNQHHSTTIRLDKVLIEKFQIIFIDFKTTPTLKSNMFVSPSYTQQMNQYKEALSDLYALPILGYLAYIPYLQPKSVETIYQLKKKTLHIL